MGDSADIVVVGAGVMGCAVAYLLAGEGLRVTVVEKESVASGASGVAAAMLVPTFDDDPRLVGLSDFSLHIHKELSRQLPGETGVDYGYREGTELLVALTTEEAARLKARLTGLRPRQPDARWVEGPELFEIEPRLSRNAVGAVVTVLSQVIASKFTLALATAAERRGAAFRHGEVTGLMADGHRAAGIHLANGDTVTAGGVVIAAGPWSGAASAWTGVRLPVYPVRGQILALRAPDPQVRGAILGPQMYVVHKADGLTLAGATEEHEAGFTVATTAEGRARIIEAAVGMAPFLADARLVHHLAGLRPGSPDALPLLGPVPGWERLHIITGHFRRGIGLSMGSATVIAGLVMGRPAPVSLTAFAPGRFGPA